ncbi:hypothetical protein BDZ89DRAFT_1165974 [Hymenopellis radicata]|nr:hypothetical protein BDZ89DRAFT_1165974 [Hymenopellis radicata]
MVDTGCTSWGTGDAGPSALDFVLAGDDGKEPDAKRALDAFLEAKKLNERSGQLPFSLQAIEELDAGPIWAYASFDVPKNISKSELYRGPVSTAAVTAVITAIRRIETAAAARDDKLIKPSLVPPADASFSVSTHSAFPKNTTHTRPILPAAARALSPLTATASHFARLLRSADSQPGVLSNALTPPGKTSKIFLYGGKVVEPVPAHLAKPGKIIAHRDGAVLLCCADKNGVWITHVRQPRAKADTVRTLHPKVPAIMGLRALKWAAALGLDDPTQVQDWTFQTWEKKEGTLQNVWVEEEKIGDSLIAYVYFPFYNGASDTQQCVQLRKAIEWASRVRTPQEEKEKGQLRALVLMGGDGYFSNGIHVGVIEAANDPAQESWDNINAIDDVVEAVMSFPGGTPPPFAKYPGSPEPQENVPSLAERGVLTISAIRGNCAAGGLAVATAADVVLCAERAVINPTYRGMGLFGSEYHRFSWFERCPDAEQYIRAMIPIGAEANAGFVDVVLHASTPEEIELSVKGHIRSLVSSPYSAAADFPSAPWCTAAQKAVPSPSTCLVSGLLSNKLAFLSTLDRPLRWYRALELQQMTLDFWHPVRSQRYHSRRAAFARKVAPQCTPLRFATFRRRNGEVDEEEADEFDDAPGWTPEEAWGWAGMTVPEVLSVGSSSSSSSSSEPTTIANSPVKEMTSYFQASTLDDALKEKLGIAPTFNKGSAIGTDAAFQEVLYTCYYDGARV